jgi:hypothetical protein
VLCDAPCAKGMQVESDGQDVASEGLSISRVWLRGPGSSRVVKRYVLSVPGLPQVKAARSER